MTRPDVERRAYHADTVLADAMHSGWGEWIEHGPFGSVVRCRFNGLHFRRVLAARRQSQWRAA